MERHILFLLVTCVTILAMADKDTPEGPSLASLESTINSLREELRKDFNTLNHKMDVQEYQLCQHRFGEQCQIYDPEAPTTTPVPTPIHIPVPIPDCSEAVRSGVYIIDAGNLGIHAYCQVDDSEKWTVIQRRLDGQVNFTRNWANYSQGFGDVAGEHWLGNEHIHALTSTGLTRLRIDLEDWENNKHTVYYDVFKVAWAGDNYKLTLSGFSGSSPPGDSFSYHAGMEFSTIDNDNDVWERGNCASKYKKGGWWYKSCAECSLNGPYNGTVPIYWHTWKGWSYSLKAVSMMIRKP